MSALAGCLQAPRVERTRLCVAIVVVLGILGSADAGEDDHRYQPGDRIHVWAERVGPARNALAAASFYSLPYCRPASAAEVSDRSAGWIGDILQGCSMVNSGIVLRFQEDEKNVSLCETELVGTSASGKFGKAVRDRSVFTLFIDDVPVKGLVGPPLDGSKRSGKTVAHVYTRFQFTVDTNGGQVVGVRLEMREPRPVTEASLTFSYSVSWRPSSLRFVDRYVSVLESEFFASKTHWLAMVNSFAIVLLMVGIVVRIVNKMLRSDLERYSILREDGSDLEIADVAAAESGWKQIGADVFRPPPHSAELCAMIGAGMHVLFAVLMFVVSSLSGSLYVTPGLMSVVGLVVYSATSVFNGYYATAVYCRMNGTPGTEKVENVGLMSGCTVPAILAVLFMPVSLIGLILRANMAELIPKYFKFLGYWLVCCLPFTLIGSRLAQRTSGAHKPAPSNPIPRPIVKTDFLRTPVGLASTGGLMPFGCIMIELYFLLTSFWGLKIYFVFDLLLVVTLVLVAVTSCSSVVCTYLLVNVEDYRWQWTSWGSGAFTGFYVLVYTILFLFVNTHISGGLHVLLYLSYSLTFAAVIGLLCGAVSYMAASAFVRTIFRNVKVD
mmetsp:Transcript_7819/g.23625  ORF Transcript_7819/g.23625 Transcript_7819/m.23625 type:complete len:609 (+) Transcript_7819:54-1880(+)